MLAIQEPSHNSHNKSLYNLSSSAFHRAHRIGTDTRTCFYSNQRLDPDNWEIGYFIRDMSTPISAEVEEGGTRTRRYPHQQCV